MTVDHTFSPSTATRPRLPLDWAALPSGVQPPPPGAEKADDSDRQMPPPAVASWPRVYPSL